MRRAATKLSWQDFRTSDFLGKHTLRVLRVSECVVRAPVCTGSDCGEIESLRIPRDRERSFHVMVNTDSTAT